MSEPKPVMTPIAINIHKEQDSPIYGDSVIEVRVEDEGGGPFIIMKQTSAESVGEIRADPDDLELILIAARQLIAGLPKEKR